jgi:putative toxin-antitoxin system antitoxin component (TIGR02293 family)
MARSKKTAKTELGFSLVGETSAAGASVMSSAIDQIRSGYHWSTVHRYQTAFQLTDKAFSRLIGVSDRTLTRIKRTRGPLDPVASDRLYRAAKVLELAVDVIESVPGAVSWLSRAQLGLGGQVPMALLDTEPGAKAVETLLLQIEYGILP